MFFSKNVSASSFRIAVVCFRMIVLSTKFDTVWLSKDARLTIIIGLFLFHCHKWQWIVIFQLTKTSNTSGVSSLSDLSHMPVTSNKVVHNHCVKSVLIRSYSGPYFSGFGLNTERYSVSLRTQSECGKMWTRITPNMDTFNTVNDV